MIELNIEALGQRACLTHKLTMDVSADCYGAFYGLYVGFIHDEANLLALAARAPEHGPQVVVKVLASVLVVDLDLEDAQPVHPGHEARQRRLSLPLSSTPPSPNQMGDTYLSTPATSGQVSCPSVPVSFSR